jgi:hypothetical protein
MCGSRTCKVDRDVGGHAELGLGGQGLPQGARTSCYGEVTFKRQWFGGHTYHHMDSEAHQDMVIETAQLPADFGDTLALLCPVPIALTEKLHLSICIGVGASLSMHCHTTFPRCSLAACQMAAQGSLRPPVRRGSINCFTTAMVAAEETRYRQGEPVRRIFQENERRKLLIRGTS